LKLGFLHSQRKFSDMQNQWRNYWDGPEYRFTDVLIEKYIGLIELSEEFANVPINELTQRLDQIRYWVQGINGSYFGGESDSWQRYTTKVPISISIKVKQKEHQVEIQVQQILLPNTRYAFVFLNSLDWFEDYLIPFRTEEINQSHLPLPGTDTHTEISSSALIVPRNEIQVQYQINSGRFSTTFRANWRGTTVAYKVSLFSCPGSSLFRCRQSDGKTYKSQRWIGRWFHSSRF
jgi:hypothetical protein